MANFDRRRRAGGHARMGRARAATVAARLGTALREARWRSGFRQRDVADRAGISQSFVSRLERGRAVCVSLETWSVVAASVGEQFVAFLEAAPGADRPRDLEHVRRQSAVVEIAAQGGWVARPELALDPGLGRSRSIDVALVRPDARQAVVVEIWDWFDDVGAGLRGLDAKVAILAARLEKEASGSDRAPGSTRDPRPWTARGLYVVRDTRRNRTLLDELRPLFAARFGGSSVGWLRALTDPDVAPPAGDGLLWSDRAGGHLRASRLTLTRRFGPAAG